MGHVGVISTDYLFTCHFFKEDTFERWELLCLTADLQALTQRDDTAARLPGVSALKKDVSNKCAKDADVEAVITNGSPDEERFAQSPEPSSISDWVAAKRCAY